MNNLNDSIKKFVGNKNTVTILGVLICIMILYFGYNMRINQKVKLTRIPYANQSIQPRTQITSNMISIKNVPESFLEGAKVYKSSDEIIGKFSNYNTIIAEGSFFYTDLLVSSDKLPNSAFLNVKEGDTVISYNVDMNSTYANSMMPDDYIKIYFKARNDDGTIMFGKFLDKVKILDVKDADGNKVFEKSDESRTPAYMLFALPEDMHLLFRKAIYLSKNYGVELILVPNTQELTQEEAVIVSSKDIQDFINDKTEMVSVDEILSNTSDEVTTDNNNNKNNDNNKKN